MELYGLHIYQGSASILRCILHNSVMCLHFISQIKYLFSDHAVICFFLKCHYTRSEMSRIPEHDDFVPSSQPLRSMFYFIYFASEGITWFPPSGWTGPYPDLYLSFDSPENLRLMEGTQERNFAAIISGQVKCSTRVTRNARDLIFFPCFLH